MVRVGIVGLGFMGKMHFRCYKGNEQTEIVAICDTDENRLKGTAGLAGNVAGAEEPLDLTGIQLYSDFEKMLQEVKLDAVSITLPSYLHRDFTVKALDAGINVLCEKPMALSISECEDMITTAEKTGKVLQVGHCLRFWPDYVKAKQIVDSGKNGKIKAAIFQRYSLPPTWSWENWLLSGPKSGGALTDLHIHDADYIQYFLGMPKAVLSRGVKGPSGDYDHVATSYIYEDDKVISAEGGWVMTPSFGFEMSFTIILEEGTIVYNCNREPAFKLCPLEGDAIPGEPSTTDGYTLEIEHFIKKVQGHNTPEVVTPRGSLESVRLILAERESIETGKEVAIR